MYKKQIEAWFASREDKLLADVSRLIAINSVRGEPSPGKPFGAGPAAALEEAGKIADGLGLTLRNMDGYVGFAEKGAGAPHLSILAHLDTVAEGAGWTREPFEATLEDGLLYGRGVSDDKGPAVAALYALAAAAEIAPLKKCARVVLGTAEETGSEDMHYYFSHERPSPMTFSPDADYPLINTEKGRFAPKFFGVWPEERTLPRIVSVRGGSTANVVPNLAEALIEGLGSDRAEELCETLGDFAPGVKFTVRAEGAMTRITAEGKNAHAAMPDDGRNAQTALIFLLSHMPFPSSAAFRAVSALNAMFPHGDNSGEWLGISARDDISGPLTLAFSVLDFSQTGFTAQFDCRFPVCCDSAELVQAVTSRLGSAGWRILPGYPFSPPHHTPADSPLVKALLGTYEEYTGNKGECLAIGGGTYVHGLPGGVAFGCAMPGTDYRIHGPDEFILKDELILSAKMFTQAILDICAGEEDI